MKSLLSPSFLGYFRRVTSSGGFIAEIDGLRFIAIGTVILFHLAVNLSAKAPALYPMAGEGHWLTSVSAFGAHGVELFFIISGFILALPFAAHYLKGDRPVRLGQYFLRRVTRLEPPYMLSLLILFGILVTLKGMSASQLIPHLLASLGYVHNVVYRTESLINNVAWSLEIEIQFYLLVPLLANIFRIRRALWRRSVIVAMATATVLTEWCFIDQNSILYLTIVRFLHFFLLGFLLADVYLTNWNSAPTRSWRWDLVSLVGWPALFYVWNHPGLSSFAPGGTLPLVAAVFFPVAAFTLYVAVFRGTLSNAVMTNAWITTIGGMCYSVYLFHNPILGVFLSLTKSIAPTGDYNINVLLQGIVVVPLMLIVTAGYFALIEKPCMRKDWPQRLWARLTRFVTSEKTV